MKEIGNKNAKLVFIENAGHIPFLENYENLMKTAIEILKFCKILNNIEQKE